MCKRRMSLSLHRLPLFAWCQHKHGLEGLQGRLQDVGQGGLGLVAQALEED